MRSIVASKLSGGIQHVYDMFYLYGFTSAFVVYVSLSWIFPPADVKIPKAIHEAITVVDGIEAINDGLNTTKAAGRKAGSFDEKVPAETDVESV